MPVEELSRQYTQEVRDIELLSDANSQERLLGTTTLRHMTPLRARAHIYTHTKRTCVHRLAA